jgi:type IX secretion system PorP/SprF family membrane protein
MRNIFYVIVVLGVLGHTSVLAQNYAVYNSYYINPYLYNPAEAASEYASLFVNHRIQWANIEGAPVLTTVNFNTLIDQTRSGFGFKASSFKRGLLNTTDFHLTYAYGMMLGKTSKMFFALSAGGISNTINIEKADASDPAITNYLSNNLQPASNFGLLLRTDAGLNFGVSLPQLFAPKFNSAESFQNLTPSPLDNVIISTYFKRKIEGKIVSKNRKGVRAKVKTKESDAPLELYALYKYSKFGTSQFEVMGKLNLSQSFWLGASYRQSYGFTGSLGLKIKTLLLSYSYEPGNQPVPTFSQGTHEMQLGLRFGQQKKYKSEAPLLRSTLKTQSERHSARFQHVEDDPDQIHQDQDVVKKTYYVVIRSFADFVGADAYKKKLIDQKFNADVFYNERDRKFYVHVFTTKKSSEAHEEARNLKNYSKLKEARVLTVIEKK